MEPWSKLCGWVLDLSALAIPLCRLVSAVGICMQAKTSIDSARMRTGKVRSFITLLWPRMKEGC